MDISGWVRIALIVGFVVALRRYLSADHAPAVARWRSMAEAICSAVDGLGGASADRPR